ncbi:MAG: hypothetical protein ACP5PZ_11255 [Bacteroidales bacterium]
MYKTGVGNMTMYNQHMGSVPKYRLAILLILCLHTMTFAQKTWDGGAGTNNWGDANNWNPNGVPTAAQSVTITQPATININVDAVCASLTINTNLNNVTININGTYSLTVAGDITYNNPNNNQTYAINVNNGTLTANNITLANTSAATRVNRLSVSTGTINVSGNINAQGNNSGENLIEITGNGTLNVGGTLQGQAFSYSLANGTVNYTSATGVTLLGGITYNNLTISGGGTKTIGGGHVTVNGVLNLANGNISLGSSNFNLILNSGASITGSFDNNHMIVCDGTGSLIKYSNNAGGFVMTYPVGTGNRYTPMVISSLTATLAGTESISVRTVESTAPGANATDLNRYWNVALSSGLSVSSVDVNFTYLNPADVGTGGDQTTYQPYIYNGTSWVMAPGASAQGVIPISSTSSPILAGIWTAREAYTTFYSYQSGNWQSAATWTLDPSGTLYINPGNQIPSGVNDRVVILNGRYVYTTTARTVASVQINEGGILDLFSSTGHNFGDVSGKGTLRLNTLTFPNGNFSAFVAAGGGTVEYYNVTGTLQQNTYNNLSLKKSDNNANNYTITLASDLTVNGKLNVVRVAGTGTMTFTIGNNATPRNIVIGGDVNVSTGGQINTFVANVVHTMSIGGNLTNNGIIRFTNRTPPVVNTYYLNDPTDGVVNVTFVGASNNTVTCNGTTDFNRFIVDKGVDQTYVLTVVSSDVNYFRIFGRNNQTATDYDPNIENLNGVLKNIWIRNGTLKLEGNILIPSLTEGGGDNFSIPLNGALWLNGPNVEVHVTNNQNGWGNKAITLFGKLRVDQGYIDFGIGAGLVYRGTGEIEINGGTLRMSQFRPSSYSTNPKTSYKQTGGTFRVIGNPDSNYELNDQKAIFCFPFPTNSFIMTGGTIEVSYATSRGAFVIGTDPSNNVVTGGTVKIIINNNNPYYFTSSAPLYNLEISKTGGTTTTVQINSVNTDGLAGTPNSITTPAQPLTVINEMKILTGNNPIFNANGQDLYIGGTLEIQNGTTLNTGVNTVYFNGGGNSQLIINGNVSGNFNHLAISNTTSLTLTNNNAATPIVVNGNFTIGSGCTLVDNGRILQVAGNIYNSGTHFKPVSGAGSIQLIGTGNQIIGGNGSGKFNNLTLNKTGGSVTAQANFTITGELRLGGTAGAPARLNMGSYHLIFTADANVYDAVTGSSQTGFSNNRMIVTNGLLSDKGVSKVFSSSVLSFRYPFGVQMGGNYYYLPATIQFTTAPASIGTISVTPVKLRHYLAQSTAALNCFWKTQSTGFSGINSGTLIQQYQYADAGPNLFVAAGSNELNYIPARYRYNLVWFTDNDVNKVDDGNNIVIFDTDTLPYGEYTAGESSAFGAITTLYSVNNGAWNNPNTWSTSPGGPAGNGGIPNASTIVKIVNNHTVTTPVAAFAGSLFIEDGSVLDLGTVTGHNFTSLPDSGVVGTGKLRIASSNYFPQGDFGIFIGPTGGTVEYYTAGSNIIVPVTSDVTNLPLTTYRNLVLTPAAGNNITLPATNLTVYGNLTVNGTGTGANDGVRTPTTASYTYTVNGNLNVDAGLLEYRNNVVQTIRVLGNLNVANGAVFRVNEGGTVVNNVLELYGSLQNNGTFDMNNTGRTYVYFKGTQNATINGSGSVYDFYNLYVDKGTDYTPILSLQSNITTGFTNPFLNLLNGTFKVDGASVNVVLSTTTAFTVPATACLSVNDGTVTVGTNNNAGDLILIGRLEVTGGTLNIGSGANFNNDIEYASAGTPTIIVSGGLLNVNGQIRRNLNNTSGALIYQQSGGTLIVNGQSQNVNRAKFEVLNASSSFTMSGGNIVIRQDGGTTYGDLYLRPSIYSVTGGTINFGDAITPANKNFRLIAGIPLWNVEVGTDAVSQTVQLYILPLTVLNDLTIQGNSVFNAAGYNVTIRHTLINENISASGGINVGGYRPGSISQITTFDGSAPMYVTGNGANLTNFAKLILNSSSTLTLQNNIQVNADLNLNAGTLNDNGNQIVLKGNVYNAATHTSNGNGGIIFSGTSQQIITGSGTGMFGNVTLNNTFGIVMKDNSRINGKLTFLAGTLYIDDYMLTLGPDATIGGTPDATRCIVLNGALSDKGVRKYFNSGDTDPFTYPIGVSSKYTPVTFDFSSNDAANGYITVKPVNQLHPNVLNVNSSKLNYYWNVTSGGLNNYTVSHSYQYVQTDVSGTEADYEGERFYNNAWSVVGTVNTTANTLNIANVNYVDGEYTAGDQPNYSALPILYSRVASGTWNDGNSWSTTPGGAGPACGCTPNGNPVVIEAGQVISINTNGAYAYSVEIKGTLDVNNTVFHNLGHISGGGRLTVDATNDGVFVLPGGNYDDFLANVSSTIELGGNVDATMPLKPGNYYKPYNHLELTGTGRKYISAENIRIRGNLSIANGTVLDNSLYDKNMSIYGAWNDANTIVDGFVPGQGKVIFEGTSQQNINTQKDENFYDLQLNNAAGLVISGNGNVVVSNILTLSNGILSSSTTPQRMVRISNTSPSAVVGGGSNAFVACPLSKNIISGQSFTFPVGDGTRYGTMSLLNTNVATSPQYWTVKYYNANPSPTYPTDASHLQSPITGVSNNEYWVVTRPTGGSANIRLRWDALSYPAYTASSSLRSLLRVVEYGSSMWTERSNAAGVSGNAVSGTITTNTPVTADDYVFTIGVSGVTATITDVTSVDICNNGEVATIPVSLTGVAPWTLTYRTLGTPTHTYTQSGINSSSYTIQLTGMDIGGTGTFTFSLLSVTDGNSMSGVVSNNTKQITVKQTYIPVMAGPTTVGSGETRSYSTTNHTGSTYQWTWQGASGGTIQTPNANATNIVFGSAGTYTLRITETYNGCSAYDEEVIVVQNVPAPNITPTTANVCQNDVVNYSTAAVAGHEYLWTVSGGSCSNCGVWTTSNSITVTWTTPGSGSVSVIESTDNTHSVTGSDNKNYNVSAAINSYTVTAAASNICQGGSTNIQLSGSQVGVTYQLRNNADNSPIGPSVAGTGGAILFPTGTLSTSTTYNVLAYNSGCQLQMSGTPTVNVQPLPTITLTTGTATACSGSTTAPLAYSATTQSPTQYSIDFDAAANAAGINDVVNQTLTASPISITIPNNISPNTYNGTLTVANALCTSVSYSIQVIVYANPSGSLTSSDLDNEICAGDNVTFTATGGVNYHFYLNGVSVQNGSANTYSTTSLSNGDEVTVVVTDGNGCSSSYPGITTTVHPVPSVNPVMHN